MKRTMMKIFGCTILALALGCGAPTLPPPNDLGTVPSLVEPRLLSVVPLTIPAWDKSSMTGGPIEAHRVQILALGDPFDHPVKPQEFLFWTRDGESVPAVDKIAMLGCSTRNTNSVICDVKPEDTARGLYFKLCYHDICLPSALFVSQDIAR